MGNGMVEPRYFVPNLEAKVRMDLQANIAAARNDVDIRNVVSLLNILVDDVRSQNDRAPIRAVMRNQGKIAAFQELLDIITKDYPGVKK
jgi:hypothetical protein